MFSDLSEEQLEWFASCAEELLPEAGDILIHEGDPADALFVILEGEIRGRRENGSDGPTFIARAGQVTGLLPFSRMTHVPLMVRASAPSRILRVRKHCFPDMLQRIPELTPRLVGILADRIRETSRREQQRDKLMALGKLSAGLAHELNNPASAAGRAAEGLRECMRELRRINKSLDSQDLSREERSALTAFEDKIIGRLASVPALDPLEQSDREEEVASWLASHDIPNGSWLAPGLVEAGIDPDALAKIAGKFRPEILPEALARAVAAVGAERLTREIEASMGRISELVRAVKEYSYMDQSPEQEIDIHQGIESTLTMLKFRTKKGVEVRREFEPNLPRVFAHGSELNQVWTNLIDNAIDAMDGKGVLTIRTSRDFDCVLVEVIDDGPGIPEDVKQHIFEPFFTTKGVGEGSGLGLDTVYRIVRGHHGDVTFESRPGQTTFQVRLPLKAGV